MIVESSIRNLKSINVLKHRLVMLFIDLISFPKPIKLILTIIVNVSDVVWSCFNRSFVTKLMPKMFEFMSESELFIRYIDSRFKTFGEKLGFKFTSKFMSVSIFEK